jgi:hypothetical protein
MGHVVQTRFFEVDAELRFETPRLVDFVRYWEGKRRDARLPSRADIDALEMKRFLGDVFMLDVIGEPPRFRYRLVGVNIVREVGRDSTGRFQDEVYAPRQAAENDAHYRWICAHRRPTRNFGVINWVDRQFLRYEIANLPLARDGATVDIILGCMVVSPAPSGSLGYPPDSPHARPG